MFVELNLFAHEVRPKRTLKMDALFIFNKRIGWPAPRARGRGGGTRMLCSTYASHCGILLTQSPTIIEEGHLLGWASCGTSLGFLPRGSPTTRLRISYPSSYRS